MNVFESSINHLVRYMYYVAGFAIVVMMAVTTTDVFLRLCVTLYSTFKFEFLAPLRPIPGTYDIVAMMGAIAAAFAMGHTTVEKGHVSVSLFTRLLPKVPQALLAVFTHALSAGLFGLLTWESIQYAQKMKASGEVSMTMELPFHPFVYGLSFSAFAVTCVLIIAIIKDMNKVLSK